MQHVRVTVHASDGRGAGDGRARRVSGWRVCPTKGAAPRNMPFLTTYEKTVWNMTLLNLGLGFMLKVGGV